MILNIETKAQSAKEIMEGKITMVRAKLNTILIPAIPADDLCILGD